MEQCFEITKESREYDNYFKYLADKEACREIINRFFNDNNIKSDKYSVGRGKLWILNNPANQEQFGSQLAKDSENGLVAFKKNSQIGRAWSALNVKTPNKPFVPFFFDDGGIGRMNTRLFHVDDRVYCSIECIDYNTKFTTPIGFIEMKVSEFFKVIEDKNT